MILSKPAMESQAEPDQRGAVNSAGYGATARAGRHVVASWPTGLGPGRKAGLFYWGKASIM